MRAWRSRNAGFHVITSTLCIQVAQVILSGEGHCDELRRHVAECTWLSLYIRQSSRLRDSGCQSYWDCSRLPNLLEMPVSFGRFRKPMSVCMSLCRGLISVAAKDQRPTARTSTAVAKAHSSGLKCFPRSFQRTSTTQLFQWLEPAWTTCGKFRPVSERYTYLLAMSCILDPQHALYMHCIHTSVPHSQCAIIYHAQLHAEFNVRWAQFHATKCNQLPRAIAHTFPLDAKDKIHSHTASWKQLLLQALYGMSCIANRYTPQRSLNNLVSPTLAGPTKKKQLGTVHIGAPRTTQWM